MAVKRTAKAALFAKIVTFSVQIYSVPLTLNYLGSGLYGLWMAIFSIIGFMQLSELGIGSALIGFIAEKRATHSNDELNQCIKKVVSFFLFFSSVVFLAIYFFIKFLNISKIFNSGELVQNSELEICLLIFFFFSCINLPLSLSQQIRLGFQEGHISSFFNAFGQLLNLGFLMKAVSMNLPLAGLIAASMAGSVLANLLNLLFLLKRKQPKSLLPSNPADVSINSLLKRGTGFFILQLAALLAYQIDQLLISHYLSPIHVTEYSVTLKYFSFLPIFLSFFLTGLWPAYSDALAKRDKDWIIKTFWKSLSISLKISFMCGIVMYFFSDWSIGIWTSNKVRPERMLVLGVFIFNLLTALGGSMTALLNGLHELKFQIFTSLASASLNLALSIFLVKKIGLSGPIWGSVIASCVFNLFTLFFIRSKLNGLKNESKRLQQGEERN
jgi:O-antigen/teichoic acid export membrane protein